MSPQTAEQTIHLNVQARYTGAWESSPRTAGS